MKPRFSTALCIAAAIAISAEAQGAEPSADARLFSGPYLSLEAGTQNIIAGADILGIDILRQDTRVVGSLGAGYRHQFEGGLVVGIEGGVGFFDGDLTQSDPATASTVHYSTGSQISYGATIGYAFGHGRNALGFVYVGEVKREFKVDVISGTLGAFHQTDRQGLIRAGIGYERRFRGPWNIRATLGTSWADQDRANSNISLSQKIEAGLGIVRHF